MFPTRKPCAVVGVAVSGGGAELINKSIASGMLGSVETSKIQIQANQDAKKTGGMFPENYAEWNCVHSRKFQLLNLSAPFALENLDIISGNPSYLAVTCSRGWVFPGEYKEI